jgi:hypothetical protein
VQILLARVESPQLEAEHCLFPHQLRIGETTMAVK